MFYKVIEIQHGNGTQMNLVYIAASTERVIYITASTGCVTYIAASTGRVTCNLWVNLASISYQIK